MAHNSSKFDQILFNRTFANKSFQEQKVIDVKSITLIPKSFEIYLTESVRFHCEECDRKDANDSEKKRFLNGCVHYPSLKTIDSINHLQSSLSTLTNELMQSCSSVDELKSTFFSLDSWVRSRWRGKTESEYEDLLTRLTQKLPFPYSYIKSPNVLEERSLPTLDKWQETYLDTGLSTQTDVDYANEIFSLFDCETISDFYDVYLTTDIELLTCVTEAWRKLGREKFQLDPINFVSLPSYGFSVWLYNSGAKIDLLQNYEDILFFEQSKRGGWSGSCGLRFSQANHPGIPFFYDPEQPNLTLIDADIVGLYSHCMEFAFPAKNFKRMSDETLESLFHYFQATKGVDLKTDSAYGFHLQCDLAIDPEYENLLEIFPPLVENKSVTDDSFSPMMKRLKQEYQIKNEGHRLIADFKVKKDYVISGFALKNYMRCGVKLLSIKAGICYEQQQFLKQQMTMNQELRKMYQRSNMTANANSIKRFSNSLYGKMLEDPKKRQRVAFVTDKKRYHRLVKKESFDARKIIDENCVLVKNKQTKVRFEKPLFIG